MPPVYRATHPCVPHSTRVGGGTCQRAMGKLYAQCTLRLGIAPLLLGVFIPEVCLEEAAPEWGRRREGKFPDQNFTSKVLKASGAIGNNGPAPRGRSKILREYAGANVTTLRPYFGTPPELS